MFNKTFYLNITVLGLQFIGWLACIQFMHTNYLLILKMFILIFFCLMMQGVFSFMHECFHDHGSKVPFLNWFLGVSASMMFGTAYTLHQVNHYGHHVRNRTRPEIAEYIFPGESKFKKTFLYYVAILGGLWWMSFIGTLLLPFIPFKYAKELTVFKKNNTYSTAFGDFSNKSWRLLRVELALFLSFWIVFITIMQWNIQTLLLIYATFAFSWSSLQWVYHIRTPIHTIEGAYNLRLPEIVRWLFLNFNYNLTHHRDSTIIWLDLYKVSNQNETQPMWYRYLMLFKPPEDIPDDPTTIKKWYF